MRATSMPFIVAATAIAIELGLVDAAASPALIGAGLLSVLIFPLTGLLLLRRSAPTGPSGRRPTSARSSIRRRGRSRCNARPARATAWRTRVERRPSWQTR